MKNGNHIKRRYRLDKVECLSNGSTNQGCPRVPGRTLFVYGVKPWCNVNKIPITNTDQVMLDFFSHSFFNQKSFKRGELK
jgi:hypothetical protein